MRQLTLVLLVTAAAASAQTPMAAARHPTSASASSEDRRLTRFLDAEFARDLKLRPQLATRLGMKEGEDRLDDISSAGQLQRLELRRASVGRMKAQFDRAKLSPTSQTDYDIWDNELQRMELQFRYRRYQPPF